MSRESVLITGASKGIGRAIAFEYARRSSNMLLCARSAGELKKICEEINSTGGSAQYFQCDVTKKEEVKSAVDYAVEKFGKIDAAILNAGMAGTNWYTDFNPSLFRQVFEVNLFGVVNFMEYLIPLMKKQGGGKIAAVSSLADSRGMPGSSPYNASKSALSEIFAAARTELKKDNIKIITIRPGFVESNITAKNEFPMPFLMSAEKAAVKIVSGIEKSKKVVSFPFPMAAATILLKILPVPVFDLIAGNADYKFKE